MSISSCHLNVTYYTRQHSFESEPKTQQIQTASGLEEDGIDWQDPGNGTWHNKHPETACHLCKLNRIFSAYGPLCSFILQHCNMPPAITNLHVWSPTIRTQGPKKSQETVCLCSQADGNTPEVSLMEIDSLKSYSHLCGCQGNCSHLFTSLWNQLQMLQLGHIVTLSHWRTIVHQNDINAWAKTLAMSTTLYVGVCAPCTLVQATWHRPSRSNQNWMSFLHRYSRCSKFQDIKFQFPMVEKVLYYLLKGTWNNLCWHGGDDVCGAVGSSGPFFSFWENAAFFSQKFDKNVKNAAESKYSRLKWVACCCWSMQCKEPAPLLLWHGP